MLKHLWRGLVTSLTDSSQGVFMHASWIFVAFMTVVMAGIAVGRITPSRRERRIRRLVLVQQLALPRPVRPAPLPYRSQPMPDWKTFLGGRLYGQLSAQLVRYDRGELTSNELRDVITEICVSAGEDPSLGLAWLTQPWPAVTQAWPSAIAKEEMGS